MGGGGAKERERGAGGSGRIERGGNEMEGGTEWYLGYFILKSQDCRPWLSPRICPW